MALSGQGSFAATEATLHLTTNADIVRQFTGRQIVIAKTADHIGVGID